MPDFQIVAAVNDDAVLAANLLKSPAISNSTIPCSAERDRPSASVAFNAALARASSPYIAFVHQDVYLPEGWDRRLMRAIDHLNAHDPMWGVLGVVGIDPKGDFVGEIWDNGLSQRIGRRIEIPTPASAIDEIVIVIRMASGLRFDAALPGYHLYAADIIQIAREQNLSTYVFNGPVIHNSLPVGQLDRSYRAAYRYMQRKWRRFLPVPTCVVPVTASQWPLWKRWCKVAKRELFRRAPPPHRHPDPASLAATLGYTATDPISHTA